MMRMKILVFLSIFAICLSVNNAAFAAENENEIKLVNSYSEAFAANGSEAEEEMFSEMDRRKIVHKYDVYFDGEKTNKSVKGYDFNDKRLENLIGIKDLFNIYDMNFKFTVRSKPICRFKDSYGYKIKYITYVLASFDFNGEGYTLRAYEAPKKGKEISSVSLYIYNGEGEESFDFDLDYQLYLTGYYIEGDLYVPVSKLYYLSAYYAKTLNLDNGNINIKTVDYEAEAELVEKYFPTEEDIGDDFWGEYYNRNDNPDETAEQKAVWANRELFMAAYENGKYGVDCNLEIGQSLNEENAFEYCVYMYQGAYEIYVRDQSLLKFDYIDELDAYVIYNKDYEGMTEYDPDLRMAAISAYDGRPIYRY